jgi:C4-dicarboxylate-binding protein DctP
MRSEEAKQNSGPVNRRHVLQLGTAAAGAAAFGFAAPAIAQAPRELRLGHNLPNSTIYHKAIAMFADEVSKLSSGKIKVTIFPSSQLGSSSEMLQSVQTGSLTMSMSVPAWYSNFMRPLDVFSLPYLISSTDKLRTALGGKVGDEISKMGDAAGFHIIGYFLIGARETINRVRPIAKLRDFDGLKIRVINSKVYLAAFKALGAIPVAMDASEIYLALQQGVIDGFETALPDVIAFKWYEVSKFVSLDSHTTDFFLTSFHKGTWDKLSAEEKDIFHKAMKVAEDFQWDAQPKDIEAARVKLQTLVKVNDIAPADKAEMVKAARTIYPEFESTIGKGFLDLAVKELS